MAQKDLTGFQKTRKINAKAESNGRWLAKAHARLSQLCDKMLSEGVARGRVTLEVNFKDGQITGVFQNVNEQLNEA